jgi:NAD(P)-dependent dehydrogenase (short-subunit alcohol dehydrogenase family)
LITIDLAGKTALVTGGTRGIGLAVALQLARTGARLYLTYRWGTADTKSIYEAFALVTDQKPVLIEADVSVEEDTGKLLEIIAKDANSVDILISNASIALLTASLDDYKKKSLFKTIEYSTWPMIDYTRKIKERFGAYPRYIIGISSDGPDNFYQGYDFVAASKGLLEIFSRYLSIHLAPAGSRVNVVRFGPVETDSFNQVFGDGFFKYLREHGISDDMNLKIEDCGKTIVALCSGLLDGVNGQILTVDNGLSFGNNIIMQYLRSKSGHTGPDNASASGLRPV